MALLFLSTGSMAGMAVMTPVLSLLIHHFGWQVALASFAVAFTLLAVPMAVFVVRDDAPEHKDLPPGAARGPARAAPLGHLTAGAAMRTQAFVVVSLGLFCCGFSMNLLGTHGMPMLMDHGFDATTSSLGIGLIGFVAIFSTLVLGRLSDRLPRKNILAAIYLVRGLGFFALLLVGTHWELYLASAIGGLVWAGSIALSSAILADVYGVRLVGVLYGTAYLGHQIGGMISSWLGGWGYETFGTHWLAFGAAGTLLLLAAALSLRLPVRGYTLMQPASASA
jgi:MFS family permease